MSNMLEIQLFILEHMAPVADPQLLFGGIRRRLERGKYDEDKRGSGGRKLLDFCELYCNLYAVSGLENNKLGSTQGRRSRFNIGGINF
jgi:hypothetical protein